MSEITKVLLAFLVAFFVGMLVAPLAIKALGRLKAKQVILGYVTQHSGKVGVPTMGGVIFLFAGAVGAFAFGAYEGNMALVFMAIVFAFGLVGFLDDFLKIKRRQNQGLKAYQKIITQVAVAVIAALYCAQSPYIGTAISLPFADAEFQMGVWYIPFAIVTFLAMTNAVNLTDGLDGLAGTTSTIYFAAFAVIIGVEAYNAIQNGATPYGKELVLLILPLSSLIGGLIAFLWHNNHNAKVFMGDTGSLALGGGAGAVALFSKNPLSSILIGIVFVWSALSVIIQVASFKLRKKRVFLMAPFHHHLELKGINESKIVGYYGIVTAVAAVASIIIF